MNIEEIGKLEKSYYGLEYSFLVSDQISSLADNIYDAFDELVAYTNFILKKLKSDDEFKITGMKVYLSDGNDSRVEINVGDNPISLAYFMASFGLLVNFCIPFVKFLRLILANKNHGHIDKINELSTKSIECFDATKYKVADNDVNEIIDYINEIRLNEKVSNSTDFAKEWVELLHKLSNVVNHTEFKEFVDCYSVDLVKAYNSLINTKSKIERLLTIAETMKFEEILHSCRVLKYISFLDNGSNTDFLPKRIRKSFSMIENAIVYFSDETRNSFEHSLKLGSDCNGMFWIKQDKLRYLNCTRSYSKKEIVENILGLCYLCLHILLTIRLRRVILQMNEKFDDLNVMDVYRTFMNTIEVDYDEIGIEKQLFFLITTNSNTFLINILSIILQFMYSEELVREKIIDKVKALIDLRNSGYFSQKLSCRNLEEIESVFNDPKIQEYLNIIKKMSGNEIGTELLEAPSYKEVLADKKNEHWKIPDDFFENSCYMSEGYCVALDETVVGNRQDVICHHIEYMINQLIINHNFDDSAEVRNTLLRVLVGRQCPNIPVLDKLTLKPSTKGFKPFNNICFIVKHMHKNVNYRKIGNNFDGNVDWSKVGGYADKPDTWLHIAFENFKWLK